MAHRVEIVMNIEALERLLNLPNLDCSALAARLGGNPEHYERLRQQDRLPFPVWDAIQRFAYRQGYAWDAVNHEWRRTRDAARIG